MSDIAGKLTEAAASSLQAAVELAKDNSQGVVAPAHLFSALLNPTQTATGQTQQTLLHSILNKGAYSCHCFAPWVFEFRAMKPHLEHLRTPAVAGPAQRSRSNH